MEKTFILDDTADIRTGRRIENISFVYDHVGGKGKKGSKLGFIKDDMCKKTVAQKIWELFDELLTVVISAIAKSGVVDILSFKNSPEYEYLKNVLEESFLANQILGISNAS